MSERYTRVFSLPENLYATGSPVVISAGALLKDNQTGKVLAQLKLTNIQYKKIKAVKVKLFPRDTMGQPLGEAIDYQYLDLQLTRDGDFGAKTPIPFPDATTRAFVVEVTSVVFSDNTAWNSDGGSWEPIPDNIPLHRKYDNLVIEQFRLEQSGTCQFVVQEHKDLWLCTCGAVNHEGEARCHDCGKQLSLIHPLDVNGITERANLRLAEEARQAAEEKAARDAEAEATKKKTAKILKFAIPAICIVVAFVTLLNSVIIPNSKYKKAVSLMEAEKYEEAINAFESLDGYKDSAEQIAKCNHGIIAEEFTRAEELMAAGDYDGAIAIFETLVQYEGSREGIVAAEAGKQEVAYKLAEALAESGKTADAAIAFGKLQEYKDAHEQSIALWDAIAFRETISGGWKHTVGLKTDGTVVSVGSNEYGQCNVSDWTDIIAVSTGNQHTVGLKRDGTVVATGDNHNGQCDVSGWKDIVAISAGYWHTVGLKSDGTVVAVGSSSSGRCDVTGWTDIVEINTGFDYTVGIQSDGSVVAVGRNRDDEWNVFSGTNCTSVTSGMFYIAGLRSDGTVMATMCAKEKEVDHGQCDVDEWANIVAISAGDNCTVGLKSDGTVVAVGNNNRGQCKVSKWSNIVAISAGSLHTVGLKSDGTVVAIGDNKYGECNVNDWTGIKLPN